MSKSEITESRIIERNHGILTDRNESLLPSNAPITKEDDIGVLKLSAR